MAPSAEMPNKLEFWRENGHGNGHRHNGSRYTELGEIDLVANHPVYVAPESKKAIEDAVRQILINVGEDPDRDGLLRTPHRVAKMYSELLEGYTQDLETVINGALFDVDYDDEEMVIVANIEYNALCEHHMLPFVGKAHVAYIPRDRVVGLSKIPRIVDMFAHRLQVQERMTNEIADAIEEALDPQGVMVVVEGQHMCGAIRGVKKHDVNMVTTAKRGEFRRNRELRDEFYRLIGR